MSIVKDIIKEEYDRLISLLNDYNEDINKLPKGSISEKKIKNNFYYYLAYRKKDRVIFEYLGKKNSDKYIEIKKGLSERRKIKSEIDKIKQNIKEIEKYIK